MSEVARIAGLLRETLEGKPYYGPSVMDALAPITSGLAFSTPHANVHSIWELVAHLTAELDYACSVIEGTAEPWTAGRTTWPAITDTSEAAWQQALRNLRQANRRLVGLVRRLDDAILDRNPVHVQGPFYRMLHGTALHTA